MVPQHIHDEIQKIRTKRNPLELGWMKTQEALHNTWWCWKRTTIDFIRQHQVAWLLWILAQVTMASRRWKNMWESRALWLKIKRFEGGNPIFLYIYINYDSLYCALHLKLQVTLYHFSSKCHNHILYALIDIEWALCYLIFGKLVDHLFLCAY
jgi:hypothetical protein